MSQGSVRSAEAARRHLVGGVDSPVRAFRRVGGTPLYLASGRGAVVTDTEGVRFVDFIMGWGALILGHTPAPVMRAARGQLGKGPHLGLTHEGEWRLAEAIAHALPGMEQVRFTASGTEACMTAIRLARAVTGRTRILRFDGCYHGHSDSLLGRCTPTGTEVSRGGIPRGIARGTLVAPYNDLALLQQVLDAHGDELACVIVEPVAANMGVVVPEREFLKRLRALTRARQIILIFDEVVTGFRVAYGGAQTHLGIRPDLTVLGKIIGGGFPIGALAGPRALMRHLAPEGDVYHAGTFAGHPVSMAAGLATLRVLERTPPYDRLERLGDRLAMGLRRVIEETGAAAQVNQCGSMLTVFFSEQPVTDSRKAGDANQRQFAAWANGLRARGILIPPSPWETLFLSSAHTTEMIDEALVVMGGVLREACGVTPRARRGVLSLRDQGRRVTLRRVEKAAAS